jgi:hypothetical protein
MRTRFALSWLSALYLICGGCLSRQVAEDGQNFRQALLDMYTNQAMENLIHAFNQTPFVQLDYKGLIVTDTQTIKASIADESDPSSAKTFARKAGNLLISMHGYTNKLFFGGSFDCNRQMQVSADPVSGNPDIYDYYLAFAREPSLFCVSDTKPCENVHMAKQYCGRWYWVPLEAAPVFMQLALKTAFLRGQDLPAPIYWSTTIDDIVPQYDENGQAIQQTVGNQQVSFNYTVSFTSEVPNGEGYADISLSDGTRLKMTLHQLDHYPFIKDVANQKSALVPDTVTSTKVLYATHNPIKTKVTAEQIKHCPALVYSNDHPNLGKKTAEAQRLEDLLVSYRQAAKH